MFNTKRRRHGLESAQNDRFLDLQDDHSNSSQHETYQADDLFAGTDDVEWSLEFGDLILPEHLYVPTSTSNDTGPKRSYDDAFQDHEGVSWSEQAIFDAIPGFAPAIPPVTDRVVELDSEENPFVNDQNDLLLHPMLRRGAKSAHSSSQHVINSLIKANLNVKQQPKQNAALNRLPLWKQRRKQSVVQSQLPAQHTDTVQPFSKPANTLPPRFGDVKLSPQELDLWNFFIGPVCKGRTLIKGDNTYLQEIAPMANTEPLVLHAILSLSATYIMDFVRNTHSELQANFHHNRAIELLGQELSKPDNYGIEKGDAIVAALMLLSHNEVINWEDDIPGLRGDQSPKWYRSGKRAELILKATNPAHKHLEQKNVQSTRARSRLGQLFCLDNVMADCVYPLDLEAECCSFPWLLNGTERDKNEIVGMTGLSSQLMHYYAKITHLSARLVKHPNSSAYNTAAKALEKKLAHLRQWSSLSAGYASLDALLKECHLDENGHVATAAKVTDLVAESYLAAAQIYLHCRLFRRGRQHPKVQRTLKNLLKAIDWQPTTGDLFSAQTPMFSVFIAGIVAYQKEDRDIVLKWFEPVSKDCRGNVGPAIRAMKYIWKWQDAGDETLWQDETHLGDVPLADRRAWWEEVAAALADREGRMNLS